MLFYLLMMLTKAVVISDQAKNEYEHDLSINLHNLIIDFIMITINTNKYHQSQSPSVLSFVSPSFFAYLTFELYYILIYFCYYLVFYSP